MTPATLFEQAKALDALGDLTGAVRLYRAAAANDPGDFRALNNLGLALEAQGDAEGAEASFRSGLAVAPDAAPIAFNLGRHRHLAGWLDEAESLYRRAIACDPEMAGAHFNLGRLLEERPRAMPAGEAEAAGREAEAVACYRRSVELDPGGAAPREGLARALHACGRPDEAIASLHAWLAREPEHALARHLLASLGGAEAPARAPDAYVRATFDRLAADFDRTLARLDYRAPRLCAEMLATIAGEPAGTLRVLDAGCGTGLCGALLKPWSRTLEGIDLSAAMLEQARERLVYDALTEAELTAWLAVHAAHWDAIVSADTICYLGALEPVLAAAFAALAPAGVLVFTLERGDDAAAYRLRASGRYAHAEGHVQAAVAAAGFGDVRMQRETLRMEGGAAVEGLVVSGRRPR